MKLHPETNSSGQIQGFSFFCPGCGHLHIFYTTGPLIWSFDGNHESPTFSPSLLNTCDNHPDSKQRRCHLNLTAGKLVFHGDCSHDKAGQVLELLDRLPE
jgi:hypothetical protein